MIRRFGLIHSNKRLSFAGKKKGEDIIKNKIITLDLWQDKQVKIKQFLRGLDYGPVRYLNKNKTGIGAYWINDIEYILESNKGYVACVETDNKLVGLAIYTDLPWESKILQKKMGAIKYLAVNNRNDTAMEITQKLLQKVTDMSKSLNIDFLMCKTHTNNVVLIHTLEKMGFLYMDTQLDYVYDFESPRFDSIHSPVRKKGFSIRLSVDPQESEELAEISHAAFSNHFGRFNSDPMIPDEQGAIIYGEWLKSSCSGWADWVLVAEKNGRIAGYSVWKKPSLREQKHGISLGHYSIGAIHPDFHGQKLFSVLTYEGMKLLQNHCQYIEGPTHINNYPVQRGYTNLGWKICDGRHSFHKWLKS